MIRIERFLAAALVVASFGAPAQDQRYDPKALARYDVSYGSCETTFPEMKGHRDEAYLSLWRATPNDKTKARLADARGSASYKAERQHATQVAAKASAPDAKKLEQQCKALWGELSRMPKPAK